MKSWIISIVSFFAKQLIIWSPAAVSNRIRNDLFKKIDLYDDAFTSVKSRPRRNTEINRFQFQTKNVPSCCIVIQGPVLMDEDFTLETIRLYKKNFPNHEIVLSTWENTPIEVLSKIKKENIHLVLSKLPEFGGPLNINFQIISSREGIKKANNLNCKYVYKTRTDQRMYGTNITEYYLALINQYPIDQSTGLKSRLIASSFTTLKFRPYGIGDMLMFGETDDMLLYWDSLLDERVISISDIKNKTIVDYAKIRLAETYLCTNFLTKMGHDLKWTLEDSWKIYYDYFCIADSESVDLFWFKYEWRIENRFEYYHQHVYDSMKHKDWLVLKNFTTEYPETILSKLEGGTFNLNTTH